MLPCDVFFSHHAVFLKVQEPKTRYRAARHQMCRMDYEDLVALVACAFGELSPGQRLRPHSSQLLRTRFRQLLGAIGLLERTRTNAGSGVAEGRGATHLFMLTEDTELVKRRGRWLAHRTMEIYLQEVNATVFFPRLSPKVKLAAVAKRESVLFVLVFPF